MGWWGSPAQPTYPQASGPSQAGSFPIGAFCVLGQAGSPDLPREERKELEKQLKRREDHLLPIFHQVAVHFADLHDTPGRMQEKGVISVSSRAWNPGRDSASLELLPAQPGVLGAVWGFWSLILKFLSSSAAEGQDCPVNCRLGSLVCTFSAALSF